MGSVLFDTSGLSKRHTAEQGRETVNTLFLHRAGHAFLATPWTYLEPYSLLVRRRNNRELRQEDFDYSVTTLQKEVLEDTDFRLLTIEDATIIAATATVTAHNLNATDSALLATFLTFAQAAGINSCLLIASDKRLLRAATAEGLPCLNPETVPASDVPALLAAL